MRKMLIQGCEALACHPIVISNYDVNFAVIIIALFTRQLPNLLGYHFVRKIKVEIHTLKSK